MNSISPDTTPAFDQGITVKQTARKEKIVSQLFMNAIQRGYNSPHPILYSKLIKHEPGKPAKKRCAQGFE